MTGILQYLPQLGQGVLITLELMVFALLFGLTLAIMLTVLSLTGKKYFTWPINAFVYFIRGTPLLVQVFLIYYGSAQFVWLRDSVFWPIFKEPFSCAVIALAFNTSAYTTVLLRGAIVMVPRGQIEAAQALGMSWLQILWRIISPQAIRVVLPAYSNEVVMILKGTSLASTITLLDLMGVTRQIVAQTYASIEYFAIAGVIYLALNGFIIFCFRWTERKLAIAGMGGK